MFAQPTPDAPLLELPLFLSPVACVFPSPAQDYTEHAIDINWLCIAHMTLMHLFFNMQVVVGAVEPR